MSYGYLLRQLSARIDSQVNLEKMLLLNNIMVFFFCYCDNLFYLSVCACFEYLGGYGSEKMSITFGSVWKIHLEHTFS